MNNLVGIVLVIAGIAGLIYGYMESQSAKDQTARVVLGRFTQKTLILLIGGAIALILGLILLL
jgi:hypothetical protein